MERYWVVIFNDAPFSYWKENKWSVFKMSYLVCNFFSWIFLLTNKLKGIEHKSSFFCIIFIKYQVKNNFSQGQKSKGILDVISIPYGQRSFPKKWKSAVLRDSGWKLRCPTQSCIFWMLGWSWTKGCTVRTFGDAPSPFDQMWSIVRICQKRNSKIFRLHLRASLLGKLGGNPKIAEKKI